MTDHQQLQEAFARVAKLLGMDAAQVAQYHKDANRLAPARKEDIRQGLLPFPETVPMVVRLTVLLIFIERHNGMYSTGNKEHIAYLLQQLGTELNDGARQRVIERLKISPDIRPPCFIRSETRTLHLSSRSGAFATVHS